MSTVGDQEKHVRVPVRVLERGRIEYFYGGPGPTVPPGTTGDLVIAESAIAEADARRLREGHPVELLSAGDSVRFPIDGSAVPVELATHLEDGTGLQVAGKRHAVDVTLRDPLTLRLKRGRTASLDKATCWISSLRTEVESLEQAFRLISDAFQPDDRAARVGDVCRHAYSQDGDTWRPLDDLRRAREARYDMLLSATGTDVLRALPSRVATVLRRCWVGDLQSADRLAQALQQYRLRLRTLYEQDEHLDLDTANTLVDLCQDMLSSISDDSSEERHRLVQSAITYLIREEDEESDTASIVGFDDDARVVRVVSKALAPGDTPPA